MENHKGTWCKYKPTVFCQEGYCTECQIYLDWRKADELRVRDEPGQRDKRGCKVC